MRRMLAVLQGDEKAVMSLYALLALPMLLGNVSQVRFVMEICGVYSLVYCL